MQEDEAIKERARCRRKGSRRPSMFPLSAAPRRTHTSAMHDPDADALKPTRPFLPPQAFALACLVVAGGWLMVVVCHAALPSHDDYFRLHLVRFGLGDRWLKPLLTYWPPMPFIGAWAAMQLGETPDLWRLTLPSALAVAVALGLWAARSQREQSDADGGWQSVALLLAIPLVFTVSASILSEPWFLAGLALAWQGVRAPAGASTPLRRAAWLVGGGVLMQASRYEGWLVMALWGPLAAARSWGEAGRARWLATFGASAVALALFPLAWLVLNQRVHGDWRWPFEIARGFAHARPLDDRLLFAGRVAFTQGLTACAFGVHGAWLLARRRAWLALAPALAPAAPFALVVARDLIGSELPERFALGALFSAALLGGASLRALQEGQAARRRWEPRVMGALGLLIGLAMMRAAFLAPQPHYVKVYRAGARVLPAEGVVAIMPAATTHDVYYFAASLPRSRFRLPGPPREGAPTAGPEAEWWLVQRGHPALDEARAAAATEVYEGWLLVPGSSGTPSPSATRLR